MSVVSLHSSQAAGEAILRQEFGLPDDTGRSRGGALGDADPAREAENLAALARTQARSGRDAEPRSLLSLFAPE